MWLIIRNRRVCDLELGDRENALFHGISNIGPILTHTHTLVVVCLFFLPFACICCEWHKLPFIHNQSAICMLTTETVSHTHMLCYVMYMIYVIWKRLLSLCLFSLNIIVWSMSVIFFRFVCRFLVFVFRPFWWQFHKFSSASVSFQNNHCTYIQRTYVTQLPFSVNSLEGW